MLRVENVSKKLDNQPVIRSVSFQVPEGCFFTLLGDSGTGKTTMLKLIAGLEIPDEGRIFIQERDLTTVSADKRQIPMIFQQPLLFPHMTVFHNIAFGLEMNQWKAQEISKRVKLLMEDLQIASLADRLPNTLSGGQQQRVSIARALAAANSLVLMDEPFSSLDPSLRQEMGQLVKKLQRRMNLTVIFVTHDVTEAMQLSDDILLIKDGEVLEKGSPQQLYERPVHAETARFVESGNLVEGHVKSSRFHCPLGVFTVEGRGDGPAVGLIPEESITLSTDQSDSLVEEIRYRGKSRRVKVQEKGLSLWVEDYSRQPLSVGQQVNLSLPEQIHLILT